MVNRLGQENIWNRLRKGYLNHRVWFSNLPKGQKTNIMLTWFYGVFGVCVFSLVSVFASQLSGIWHFAAIMGGTALLALFWANSMLHYGFYLEKRIKALELEKNG